jgi:hypothetical protein
MRARCAFAFIAAALAILPAVICASDRSDRYVAWLADGTRLSARSLSAWPVPGSSFRFENHELLDANNPVRLIHDRQAAVSPDGPLVMMANGDVLPGAPAQLEPDEGRVGQTPRVRIQLQSPLVPVTGPGIAVRTDRVQRIIASLEFSKTQPPAGSVVLADGRRLTARSIRWREYGLAILTAAGVVEATFTELADVVFPNVDVSAAVLDDNLWAGGASGVTIARFQTAGGAILTAARVSREHEQSRRRGRVTDATYYYAQPAWADQPLAIPEQEIVCCGYRPADEAPLSLLPATTVVNRRLLGEPQPWTTNRSADGDLLAAAGQESDIGIAAHAASAIAFDLPDAAKTLEVSVALDPSAGSGGCVRCQIVSSREAQDVVLWDSGVIQGKDGLRRAKSVDVKGLKRVMLVTHAAHEDRPPGADPLDIRDDVVWLAPLVKLDFSEQGDRRRALVVLPGAADWELHASDAKSAFQLASRWNVPASHWDSVVALPKGETVTLTRTLRVTRASDIVELLTVCPVDLEEHDFLLKVNGSAVAWHNNADRNQLRQWTLRYSRSRSRDGIEESNLTDRLAYWWDLSPWRGQDVELELTLGGRRERSEIAWRGLSIRSAIGNLPDGKPVAPDVGLTALAPIGSPRGQVMKDAIPRSREGEPIRFLGQQFRGGYGLARDNSITFKLEPGYDKFVAVVGCPEQVAGPVQVLIDDRVFWERAAINSLSPAEQIEIEIPAGAKTLTLQSGSEGLYYGFAAFAEAGFIVGKAAGRP